MVLMTYDWLTAERAETKSGVQTEVRRWDASGRAAAEFSKQMSESAAVVLLR